MPQRDNLPPIAQHGDVIDESGRRHRICWTGHTSPLIVDGEPATLAVDHQDTITFSTVAGAFTCSSEALWFSFAGTGIQPTAREGGRYLAHAFANWMRVRSMEEQVRDARSRMSAVLAQPLDEITLPQFHFDPLVEQVLQLDDGTPQTRAVLVQLLRRLEQTAPTAIPPGFVPYLLGTTEGGATVEVVVADEQKTKEPKWQRSRFTPEQLVLLEQAYQQAAPGTYRALAARLAQEWNCSVGTVYSAFYTGGWPRRNGKARLGGRRLEVPVRRITDHAPSPSFLLVAGRANSVRGESSSNRRMTVLLFPVLPLFADVKSRLREVGCSLHASYELLKDSPPQYHFEATYGVTVVFLAGEDTQELERHAAKFWITGTLHPQSVTVQQRVAYALDQIAEGCVWRGPAL